MRAPWLRTARPWLPSGDVALTAATHRSPDGPVSFDHPANAWSATESYTWQAHSARTVLRVRAYVRAADTWASRAAAGHDDGISAMPRRYSPCSFKMLTTSSLPLT